MNLIQKTSTIFSPRLLCGINSSNHYFRLSANTGAQCNYSIWNKYKINNIHDSYLFNKQNHNKLISNISTFDNISIEQIHFISNKRFYSNKSDDKSKDDNARKEAESTVENADANKNLGLFARFKQMSKQYWYVLLPVHAVTSCCWLGGFYYLSSR